MILLLACADPLPYGSTAEDCGSCHADHYAEWSGSPHATMSDVFVALRDEVEITWGEPSARACDGCHSPGWGGDATIGCVACHAAVGDSGTHDGRVTIDLDAPLSGPLALQTPAHGSTPRGYLDEPSLCGACHEVTGPNLFVEETWTEFKAADSDETCQDCHMPALPDAPWTATTPARPRRDHGFAVYGTDLLAEGLEITVEGDEVVLTNHAGHAAPTGVSFLRSIRVEAGDATLIRLGSDPVRDGQAVALVTDADSVRSGTLESGASVRAPIPPGTTRITLRASRVRPEVTDALGIAASAALDVASIDLDANP